MTKLEKTLEVIDLVRAKEDTCVLMCSLGKDSIVVLDLIYPKYKKIYCVFMYFVKGLEHVERWVRWVKAKYPNVEFVQVPHWNLTYILRSGLYCTPNPKVKLLSLKDVAIAMRKKYGCTYVYTGMKLADSMNRRLMLMTYKESNYENNGFVYPLAEWTQKEILSYMRQHNLPEPVRYDKNASSGIGFNEACFLWMRERFPQDLEKIYEAFPLSRRILYEHDLKNPTKTEM